MTELETMECAKMYIEKLANGIGPLSDEEIKDDSVINNVRISRCLFYTCGVLQKLIDNDDKVITDNLQPVNKKRKVVTVLGVQHGIHTVDGINRTGIPYQKLSRFLHIFSQLNYTE